MQKICLSFLFVILFVFGAREVLAQTPTPISGASRVNAGVTNPIGPTATATPTPAATVAPSATTSPGATTTPAPTSTPVPTPTPFYLDIFGIVSPDASIVMYSDDKFVRSTVADEKGNFSIPQIAVNPGFTSFCLEAIDFERIGESYTCYELSPVYSDTKKEVFLPPTIGLSARTMRPGASVFAFGYTMPGARTTVHISRDIVLEIKADSRGFYKTEIKELKVGKYQLFATANFENKDSDKPSRTVGLESLSEVGAIQQDVGNTWKQFFTSTSGFFKKYGWIAIPVIILIFILLSKKLRDRLRAFLKYNHLPGTKTDHGFGHHFWFVGE